MKGKKISKACGQKNRNGEDEAGQVEIKCSGCSIMKLPSHLIAAILFRLSIKEILVCICKSFYATISNPKFAQSEVFPIARTVDYTHVSRILYPLELEQDEWFMDTLSSPQRHYSEICQVSMKFDSKLKIPLRNFPLPLVLRDSNEEITLIESDHCYKIVNSCNGFLCLSEPMDNKHVIVCNLVTGEFINLPQVIEGKNDYSYDDYIIDYCGYGFSPKTNQYKVVRMFEQYSDPQLCN